MTRLAVRLLAVLLAVAAAQQAAAQAPPLKELAPMGKVRVAIAVGAVNSAFWSSRNPTTKEPQGVAVDFGHALGKQLGVPVEFVVYTNSGDVTDAGPKGEWDVTFLPQDETRAKIVDFGSAYVMSESTYMVLPDSPIRKFEEVDRPGVRVAGIANTATGRSVERTLTQATLSMFRTQEEIVDRLKDGRVDAIALSREALSALLPQLPGARILDGHFHEAPMAVAVPKGHRDALAYMNAFVEQAKASGEVRRALDRAGLPDAIVAPAARR